MDHNTADEILRSSDDLQGARHIVEVEGMSSPRVCALLNRLVAGLDPGEHYLEIGTWKGRTLLSAAYGNRGRLCMGCDKFRLWGRFTGFGVGARRSLHENIDRYRTESADMRVFDMTSRRLFARRLVPAPIGVFFYDGGHGYEDTRHGIEAAAPLLSTRSFVLVDDWNDPVVRRASFDAIVASKLDVLWHRHLEGDHTERGFWNGVGVFWVRRARA